MDIVAIPGFSEPVSCWTHLLGAGVAAVASFWLIRRAAGDGGRIASLAVYVFGVLFMFSMSGTYHLLEPGGTPRAVLLRLDHAAIWVMIAGTFTPIHQILFRGFWRWGFLTLLWTAAITGLTLKTIFFSGMSEALGLVLYLGMGWLGFASVLLLAKRHGRRYALPLAWGGIAYTSGAILEFLRWPVLIEGVIGPHELFHLAVIAGVIIHWRFIYRLAGHQRVPTRELQSRVRALAAPSPG